MSDATSASLTSTNPGTANTSERSSGSAGAVQATFLGCSSSDTSKMVVQINSYGAPGTPTVDASGNVNLTVPAQGTGSPGTTNYLVVQQSVAISNNWSFNVNINVANKGAGSGTLTFSKGTGGGGDYE